MPLPRIIAYILSTLAIIQIWNFSTFYINLFGRNGVRDHIFLFINMYLLYYIGEGTRLSWVLFRTQYHIAWALILINIGVQYLISLYQIRENETISPSILHRAFALFGEAALVLLAIRVDGSGFSGMTLLSILFGLAAAWYLADEKKAERLDFRHLSERAMLFVVFTFGEMIITISSYFDGELTLNSVYFSLMAFLIVAGLFLSYEILYNHIINRDRKTTGTMYMMVHIFLIFSMNNLTNALEFMQETRVSLIPKTVFLISSFLLFYFCLYGLMYYAKRRMRFHLRDAVPLVAAGLLFAVLMWLLRDEPRLNIALSVIFVYAMFARIYIHSHMNL